MYDKSIIDRFWSKVEVRGANECWSWLAGTNSLGYGGFRVKRKNLKAHRVSWELHNGPIPENDSYHGMCICHKCDNPNCVNPSHLFIGSHYDNVMDRVKKGRCVVPKEYSVGTKNHSSKLKDCDIINIRAIYKYTHATQVYLANIYKVSGATISYIINNKAWGHI